MIPALLLTALTVLTLARCVILDDRARTHVHTDAPAKWGVASGVLSFASVIAWGIWI
jgi:hypothetical protein